jgi:hypothetical protein
MNCSSGEEVGMQKYGLHHLRAIRLFVVLLLAMVAVLLVLGSKSVSAQTLNGDPPFPRSRKPIVAG